MPPYFGVSSAGATRGAAPTVAPSNAAARSDLSFIVSPCSAVLFVKPYRFQVLIEIMTGADLPTLYIRAVGNNAVIPEQEYLVGLAIEHMLLEVAHQDPLLRRVGLPQHPIVQINLLLVVELSIARDIDRSRQVPLHIEQWVDHTVAIAVHDGIEIAVPHRLEPGTRRQDALRDVEPDLAPLIDHPGRVILVGLVDVAIHQLEGEPLGAGLLQESLRLRPRFVDVGPEPGHLFQLCLVRCQRRARESDAADSPHIGNSGKLWRAMPAVNGQG